jgi:hypothetical protein
MAVDRRAQSLSSRSRVPLVIRVGVDRRDERVPVIPISGIGRRGPLKARPVVEGRIEARQARGAVSGAGDIAPGRQERRRRRQGVAFVPGAQRDGQGEIAARRFPHDRKAAGVETVEQAAIDGESVVEPGRKRVLRRQAVAGREDFEAQSASEPGGDRQVFEGAAGDVRAAVKVKDAPGVPFFVVAFGLDDFDRDPGDSGFLDSARPCRPRRLAVGGAALALHSPDLVDRLQGDRPSPGRRGGLEEGLGLVADGRGNRAGSAFHSWSPEH